MFRIPMLTRCTLKNTARFLSYSKPFLNINSTRKIPKSSRTIDTIQKLRRFNRTNLFKNHDSLEKFKSQVKPCVTITSCERYNTDEILNSQDLKDLKIQALIPNEILHFKYKENIDVLILGSGSIVAWGVDEQSLNDNILPSFRKYMISPYDFPESEDMDYIETSEIKDQQESHLIDETIIINANEEDQILLDKAAFSSGLSRSTRLAVLESSLERHIAITRKYTEGLSVGKKLTITEEEVLRLTGRLFLLRGKLNLYSELIETPDLYWTEPTLEKIYRETSNILDVSPRIAILNTKLDYATEESRALMSTLNEQKGTRLEWIIIYLIMIEVCFESYHFYERYVLDKQEKNETVI